MDTPNPLSGLKIDVWYKAFMVIGALGVSIGLLFPVTGITNGQLELLSVGIFLMGVGEWKNWKESNRIVPPNAYTGGSALHVKQEIRQPDLVGYSLMLVGVCMTLMGVFSIILAARADGGASTRPQHSTGQIVSYDKRLL